MTAMAKFTPNKRGVGFAASKLLILKDAEFKPFWATRKEARPAARDRKGGYPTHTGLEIVQPRATQ
ncbi:hypothetical protein LCGC14_1826010 [marine sediment metagenome]|uniref:Uncharacterized protein n=1 Tax=marine sediment metagenome TaxID=412755 RepID=A0A0F9H5Q2_9ZZZZ